MSIFATLSADIWYDPLFLTVLTIVTTLLVGILTALVAYWIYRKQRPKTEITYQIISDIPIVSINEQVKNRVKIYFDGTQVENARVLVLKIWNSGNVAVKRDDYEKPIIFEFEGSKVVSCDILDTDPPNLIDPNDNTLLISEPDSVKLSKFLLNPNESIRLKAFIDGSSVKIRKRGRLIGGNIREFNPESLPVTIRVVDIPIVIIALAGGLGFVIYVEIKLIPYLYQVVVYVIQYLNFSILTSKDFLGALGSAFLLLALVIFLIIAAIKEYAPQISRLLKNGFRLKW